MIIYDIKRLVEFKREKRGGKHGHVKSTSR